MFIRCTELKGVIGLQVTEIMQEIKMSLSSAAAHKEKKKGWGQGEKKPHLISPDPDRTQNGTTPSGSSTVESAWRDLRVSCHEVSSRRSLRAKVFHASVPSSTWFVRHGGHRSCGVDLGDIEVTPCRSVL